jgi:hypothetical protein
MGRNVAASYTWSSREAPAKDLHSIHIIKNICRAKYPDQTENQSHTTLKRWFENQRYTGKYTTEQNKIAKMPSTLNMNVKLLK